ncbi:MAG: hypothetical protein ACE5OO_02170 [Candidatus Bathyarchaeia archaeon]
MPYNKADVKLYAPDPSWVTGDVWLRPWAPPPLKEVFDAVGLSEVALAHKGILASDSLSLSDTPLRDWMPRIPDAVSLSEVPLIDKDLLVTDLIQIISEISSTPEKIKFVTDLLRLLEDFYDVWKGRWDEPILNLYQALRELQLRLVTEKDVELKVKEA